MASFDRTIPPGGEGKIKLTVDTKGYEGNINKTAAVYTNDPKIPQFTLRVRALVEVPISVNPRYVRLYGREDLNVTRSIVITAGLDKPLTLEPGEFDLKDKLTYRMEEVEKGRKFRVDLTNIPGAVGPLRGSLTLQTNYEEKPIVTIRISGRLMKGNEGGG